MFKLLRERSGASRIAKLGALAVVLALVATAGVVAIDSPPYFPTSQKAVGAKPLTSVQAPTQSPVPEQTVRLELGVQDAETPWAITLGDRQNPIITVKRGDTVEVTLTNNGQTVHDFTVEEFGVTMDSTTVDPGESVTVTFIANRAGTFTYFCAQPGHKELGMKGTLIVT